MALYSASLALWIAVREAELATIVDPAGTPTAELRSATNDVLAVCTIDKVASNVNQTTGLLTLVVSAQEDAALLSGVADNLLIKDGLGQAVRLIPVITGTTPVAGKFVMNTTNIIVGVPFTIVSLTFPVGTLIS